ncbi:MAG: hypothetical protein RIR26_814 [Pseudomonadota bacterium]
MDTKHPSTLGRFHSSLQLEGLECRVLETEDGSYSLQYLKESHEWTEPMHSSKGAWEESLFIYESALRESMLLRSDEGPWTVASVGLGLGYLEILAAGLSLQAGWTPEEIRITSYESRAPLRHALIQFLTATQQPQPHSTLDFVYADILRRVADFVRTEPLRLKKYLRDMWTEGSLSLEADLADALPEFASGSAVNNCLLFDAFSPESSPDVWDESLLEAMVNGLCGTHCIVASYASRTVLKRVLKSNGFALEKKIGFSGKRESTYARRKKEKGTAFVSVVERPK